MGKYINLIAKGFVAIICIVIGIGSFQIAYETYAKIDYNNTAIDDTSNIDVRTIYESDREFFKSDWKRDTWYKIRTRQESNLYSILYSSVFVFCVSLICFTYICVKK